MIDLTYGIARDMVVYPGDPDVEIKLVSEKPRIHKLCIATHHGTHIDAPLHHLENGRSLDGYKPEKFVNKACCIRIKKCRIARSDLEVHSSLIRRCSAVVIDTGYEHEIKEGCIGLDFPYLTEDAAEFLSSFGLNIVGIDSPSIDQPKKDVAHRILLSRDILPLETLINTYRLPERFVLISFPLLVEATDGAPCRAVAIPLNTFPFYSHKGMYTKSC